MKTNSMGKAHTKQFYRRNSSSESDQNTDITVCLQHFIIEVSLGRAD